MRHLFIALFVMLSTVVASAQFTAKGKVFDENGQALIGATVRLQNSSIGKSTNKDGVFSFEGLSQPESTVEVSYVGYETAIAKVTSGKDAQIKLVRKSFDIDEVTITSIRATDKSAVAYSNVTSEQIEQRNMGQDIPYLLALTPSFVATSDAGTGIGYTGYRVRGTDANRVNVTVNGVPLNDSESHGVFFVNMPDFASSLQSVQVQRGVGTSTNGAAAFGASINMQTEGLVANPYGEISSSYGSFNTNKNTVKAGTGLLGKKWAIDARLSNITSDGYIDRAWVDMKSYYLSGAYYGQRNVLKFITFAGNEKTYQAWNGVSLENLETNRTYNEIGYYIDDDGNEKFYDNQTDNYKQNHYQLHWLNEINNEMHFNAVVHYTRGKGYYEDYKQNRKYKEYMLTPAVVGNVTLSKTDLVRQKWLDNHFGGLTSAFNYNGGNVDFSLGGAINLYNGEHYGKVIWVRNAAPDYNKEDDWYRNNGLKFDGNIYAKATYTVGESLFVNGDLQYRFIDYTMKGSDDKFDDDNNVMRDITQRHIYAFVNPKIGLSYLLGNNSDVYASYSIANREPNRNNYTEAGPNEVPRAETLYDLEGGYRYQSSDFSAGVNLYYMKYKNQLILTGKISEIGELLTTNIPDSYRAGIELTMAAKITDFLRWDANLALSSNKILDFTEEDVDVYDADWNWVESRSNEIGTTNIAYSPSVVANNIITISHERFEWTLHSSYVGKQYIDNTSDEVRSMPAYFLTNLSMRYSLPVKKVLKSIDFGVVVNNLFNKQYVSNGYTWYSYYLDGKRENDLRFFPQAETNVLAGITLKF